MAETAPSNHSPRPNAAQDTRQGLRSQLLADRERFAGLPSLPAAQAALEAHLARLLHELEPEMLGVYCSVRSEFNAIGVLDASGLAKLPLALPFARRQPVEMHYRAWDRKPPTDIDECGLPVPSSGPERVPDVVLVPCLGFTRTGYRLGYGGGYFDRWLARHPHVTSIGIAWSIGELDEASFAPQEHDVALTMVLTELGVVAS